MKMVTAWLDEMNWMEAKQAIKDSGGIVLIPVGSLEQWGHLPIGCDGWQAMAHVNKVIELAQEDDKIKQILALPLLPISIQNNMHDFPGSIGVRYSVMHDYYKDIAKSLIRHGVMKFIWCVGHGGAQEPIMDMGKELKEEYGVLGILDRGYYTAGEWRGPRPAGARQMGHGTGGYAMSTVTPETLERCRPRAKTWLSKGKTFYPWGTDDFTDVEFDHGINSLTGKLKTSLNSKGQPMTVFVIGSWQEIAPYGSMGEPSSTPEDVAKDVEESRRFIEISARHTIAIIKAISKIKVPLKSSPREDIENI